MEKTLISLLCLCLLVPAVFPATIGSVSSSTRNLQGISSTPVAFIYINGLSSWYGEKAVPAALGVPGFTATPLPYNYVALAFWTYPSTPVDASAVWANISSYVGTSTYGSTNQEIQATLKKNFTNAGVKLLVSAFGSTQTPTSSGFNATECGLQLAKFVKDNQLDGVDIDWEDTAAFQRGDKSGENWLITLTKVLRANLPADAIITHAPQAPYFSGKALYPQGGYLAVDQEAGSMINFYNVQFYNQGVGLYDSAQGLFNSSGGWCPKSSINEIIAAGVPSNKIVLGKPASTADASNGWMSAADLNDAIAKNYAYNGWNAGIMFWQLTSDISGNFCNAAGKGYITQLGNSAIQSTNTAANTQTATNSNTQKAAPAAPSTPSVPAASTTVPAASTTVPVAPAAPAAAPAAPAATPVAPAAPSVPTAAPSAPVTPTIAVPSIPTITGQVNSMANINSWNLTPEQLAIVKQLIQSGKIAVTQKAKSGNLTGVKTAPPVVNLSQAEDLQLMQYLTSP